MSPYTPKAASKVSMHMKHCLKTGRGFLLTSDIYLKIPGYNDIYVVGDAAELKDRQGHPLPPTAMTAIASGQQAAENLLRARKNKPLKASRLRIEGIAIALGGKYAVIDMHFIRLWGYPAYLLKKLIEKRYKWPLWYLAFKGYRNIEACEL